MIIFSNCINKKIQCKCYFMMFSYIEIDRFINEYSFIFYNNFNHCEANNFILLYIKIA